MRNCELCGEEVQAGAESCPRCGFVFRLEIRADARDDAILRRHAGKSAEAVNRDMRNARAQLAACLDNMAAKSLSREELASLADEALAFLGIPLDMGVEDELRFDPPEAEFIGRVAENLERADAQCGSPVGNPATYLRLSNALQAMGEPARAMSMVDKALLLNPRDRDAMFARAKLLFHAKRYPQARRCLEKLAASGKHENASFLIELIEQITSE